MDSDLELELVAIDMGYGHLRPAHALADFLGGPPILLADQPPLASPGEMRQWASARRGYEFLSQAGRFPLVGSALAESLQGITSIPSLYPRRDLSRPSLGVKMLERAGRAGMGRGLAARLQRSGDILLTTFFAPAVLADLHGCERIYCVVTDSDVNRIWAPIEPRTTQVTYLAPTPRVRRRLKAYGVPSERIVVTGYPLPHSLLGGPDVGALRRNLRRRLVALDPRGRFLKECREEVSYFLGELPESSEAPLHLVFAVGGAGAQSELAARFLPSLARRLRKRKLKLTLVAGLRPEVAATFQAAIAAAELKPELDSGAISVLLATSHAEYFRRFDELLAEADVLWTKPSELSFYGALGIPLVFSWPVGAHERYNRRWTIQSGAGIKQMDPAHAGDWLWEMVKDGTLAGAAWTGYMRMPKFGLYRIVEEVLGKRGLERHLAAHGLSPSATLPPPPPHGDLDDEPDEEAHEGRRRASS
jgi:hypothetical protein